MRRAVLDPGVLVSALISTQGAPAELLRQVRVGALELIVSPLLLAELEGVLEREKFRRYFSVETARAYAAVLRDEAIVAADPTSPPPLRSADPDDDYLIALALQESACLVSGDAHLLALAAAAPIFAPAEFLAAPD